MLFENFIKEINTLWTDYLKWVMAEELAGHTDSAGGKILYPNILLVTECSGYYVAELVGAAREFHGLKIKKHKEPSIHRYLNQFDQRISNPVITFDAACNGVIGFSIAHKADYEEVKTRFPQIDLFPTRAESFLDGFGSTIGFGNNFTSCFFENCILVNQKENVYRCKNILSASIVKASISRPQLLELFKHITKDLRMKGVHTARNAEDRLIVGGQLQNMYLFPKLHETTIGEFFNLHPEILKTAFKSDDFKYEPFLDWIEHDETCTDRAINPDLLIKRADGYYDIYDLKTAQLDKKSITKGDRNRRRFIDYVEDGISQLANYREYFQYSKNAEFAYTKYGIKVCNPQLVLVVGSWENVDIDKVNQACRKYNKISIIDYDTLCQMFIGMN